MVVDRPVADALVAKLKARAEKMRLGYGLDVATDVGPLINPAALAKVAEYVTIGRREADLVCGGSIARDGDLANGSFFQPTIFSNVAPMARIAQEEIFGPVLSVIPVDGYDEVVKAVNGTRYGLSSSIFTENVNTAFRAMRDFETGIVYVNAGTIADGDRTVQQVGKEIFDLMLRVASGERTKAEILGHHEFVPWRIGPVM